MLPVEKPFCGASLLPCWIPHTHTLTLARIAVIEGEMRGFFYKTDDVCSTEIFPRERISIRCGEYRLPYLLCQLLINLFNLNTHTQASNSSAGNVSRGKQRLDMPPTPNKSKTSYLAASLCSGHIGAHTRRVFTR